MNPPHLYTRSGPYQSPSHCDPEEKPVTAGLQLFHMLFPGCLHIASKHGQNFLLGNLGPVSGVPSGHCIDRNLKAFLNGDSLQIQQMFRPISQFIFQLDSPDGAVLAEELTLYLLADLPIKSSDIFQIPRIAAPERNPLLYQPIGKTSVSDFPMYPGTDAKNNLQATLLRSSDKCAEIPAAREVKASSSSS